jgi:hypothetical protein
MWNSNPGLTSPPIPEKLFGNIDTSIFRGKIMSKAKGCFKPALIGCGALTGIFILVLGVTALVAWFSIDDRDGETAQDATPTSLISAQTATGHGRVILNLAQGEFEIEPAAPGEGVSIEARFDPEVYELEDRLTTPGDQWEYQVDFRRTMSGLQAFFRAIMSQGGDTYFRVYLPAEAELELLINAQEGGLVTELGGLNLTEADITVEKGGFVLNFASPLQQPMRSLIVRGAMGGFDLSNLGNASPALLDIRHKMGGANIDLDGEWLQDSDIRIGVRMGGTAVNLPRGVTIEGAPGYSRSFEQENPEIPLPVLRFTVSQSMGEIDFSR